MSFALIQIQAIIELNPQMSLVLWSLNNEI
jgi:hypothetical protein